MLKMARGLVFGLLVTAFHVSHAAPMGVGCAHDKPRLDVKLAVDKHVAARGQPIAVTVMVTNSGDDVVRLHPFMELEHYGLRFEVIDENGKPVRWLGPEVKMIETDERVALYPGYTWGRTIKNFETRYDLSRPGKYTVRAMHGVGPDGACATGKRKSNAIRLRLLD